MFGLEVPDYSLLTASMLLVYALAGVFGALVRVAWLDKPLKGFYRDEDGGLHMGFFAEVIIGIAVAIAIDGHPVRAGIAAVFAPFILDAGRSFIDKKLPKILELMIQEAPLKDVNTTEEEELLDDRDN